MDMREMGGRNMTLARFKPILESQTWSISVAGHLGSLTMKLSSGGVSRLQSVV